MKQGFLKWRLFNSKCLVEKPGVIVQKLGNRQLGNESGNKQKKDILTFLSSNIVVLILDLNVFIMKMLKGRWAIYSPLFISGMDGFWNCLAQRLQLLKGAFKFHQWIITLFLICLPLELFNLFPFWCWKHQFHNQVKSCYYLFNHHYMYHNLIITSNWKVCHDICLFAFVTYEQIQEPNKF